MKHLSFIFIFVSLVFYNCNENELTTTNQNVINTAPLKPHAPIPADSSVNVSNIVVLRWQCSDPDPNDTLKYDIYFSKFNPPATLAVSNYLLTTYDYGIVDTLTTFYWKVVAKDNHGASTTGNIWRFTTAP